MSSKRFAGEVIWGSCALGFNETCFGFCVFARGAIAGCHRRVPLSCAMVGGGEGDDQLWGGGCGAVAGCHCGVPFWCAMIGGVDVVRLLGAIAGCHCGVLQSLGEWVWCHCWVPLRVLLWCFGGDVVPLQGAIVVCYGGGRGG